MRILSVAAILVLVGAVAMAGPAPQRPYAWMKEYDATETVYVRIGPPDGYARAEAAPGTFANWLRWLPLKKGDPPVRLFNGKEKSNQKAHFAVVDIDTGTKDLQQCADAVIRLRAEYLWSVRRFEDIHFTFTSGDRVDFTRWLDGFSPAVRGSTVRWVQGSPRKSSYATFREYLDTVFTYAGTLSLSKELKKVASPADMQLGDVLIQGGSPGHAVIVVDMAAGIKSGKKVFMLAQGFMPAQDIHILRNPASPALSPWYDLDLGDTLKTPEWTFSVGDLRRF